MSSGAIGGEGNARKRSEKMIAFTYDLSTAIGQTRLYAGDVDPDGLNRTGGERTRSDDEIAQLLVIYGDDARLAAAALLESKAAEFALYAINVCQGSLRQDYRERSLQLRECAKSLRLSASAAYWNPPANPNVFAHAGDRE